MESQLKYTEEWLSLAKQGNFKLAETLYFEKLFSEIIINFEKKYSNIFDKDEVLISMLGFSPEPIILTANAVNPIKHYIITTEHKKILLQGLKNLLSMISH